MNRILLRPGECAELLGISRSMVYLLVDRGDLPVVRLGKSVRVPIGGLNDVIEQKTAYGCATRHADQLASSQDR
jgi:excisionase family DNA binding protein